MTQRQLWALAHLVAPLNVNTCFSVLVAAFCVTAASAVTDEDNLPGTVNNLLKLLLSRELEI